MFSTLRLFVFLLLLSSSLVAVSSPSVPFPVEETTASKTVLLLAHRWESKTLLLDLKVDGTFEGRLPSGVEFYGLWEMKSDRKTLVLQNDPLDEEEFEKHYEVVEVSFDKLRLKNTGGKTVALYLVE